MKFTCTIEINRPIDTVMGLFMNKDIYKHWKKDFISYENISGIAGEVGAITKLSFKRVTLFETITLKRLPYEIVEEYEHKRGNKTIMIHRATNQFIALSENKTQYNVEFEMIKIFGLLPKIIMTLMAGAGRKYAQIQLNQFKAFAEK